MKITYDPQADALYIEYVTPRSHDNMDIEGRGFCRFG